LQGRPLDALANRRPQTCLLVICRLCHRFRPRRRRATLCCDEQPDFNTTLSPPTARLRL
jgi:hypothetical protein